jgi:hypothetical protein
LVSCNLMMWSWLRLCSVTLSSNYSHFILYI